MEFAEIASDAVGNAASGEIGGLFAVLVESLITAGDEQESIDRATERFTHGLRIVDLALLQARRAIGQVQRVERKRKQESRRTHN